MAKCLLWEEVKETAVVKGMQKTTLNKGHCAFPKVEQRVCCRIPMEATDWTLVRRRRNEDAYWMPILKGSDDSAVIGFVVAFAVEQPFCPRGACDNCSNKFRFLIMRGEKKDTYASKVFIVNGFKSAKPSNPPKGLFGPIPLIAEVSRIAFKEGFIFS